MGMCGAGVCAVGVATYGSLCDGDMWGESGRVGCIRSRVYGASVGTSGEEVGVFGGWIDVGVLGGGWTRESGGGQVRGGCTDELVYLVSVGVECVCVKGSLVLVLVLDWTQCLPQGVGAPPAMLRGRTAGLVFS